jgi:uncharacterized protein
MKRFYKKLLFEYLELFPCVAILGVRQCGKTTMLKELPDDWKIFDLEKESDYQIITRDTDLFLRLNKNHIAIDESQLHPKLFPALRVAIDNDRNKKGRFVLTGSSSPELIKSISESLAGRVGLIELSPFSLCEAFELPQSDFFKLLTEKADIASLTENLKIQCSIKDVHDYWLSGAFPEPWLVNKSGNNKRFLKLWMQNYIQTYIFRDILRLFPGLNQEKFRMFFQMLSNVSGNIINYSTIARSLGVSQPTVREYCRIAHGTYIWRQIPPYVQNAAKRVVKHPKGYLRDSGMLHFLLHIDTLDSLLSHPVMGFSWEAMVIEEIIRGFKILGVNFDYYYYRTGAGAEVDLILEGEMGLLPIEIKYSQTASLKELRGIRDFIKEKNCKFGIVINNSDKIVQYTDTLVGIPFGAV